FVLVSEMLNTVAETLVDLISPSHHPLAKVVKDVTAGAVLLAAIISVVVGLVVLGPPLWARVSTGG
ncbi:MAG: diacylglycerol kinase family protein, partial [Chloroflexi bacterium]|nr:diacylglycerol kinase family protein [Chloroflexota bacterium]